jgi:hypothetical protein
MVERLPTDLLTVSMAGQRCPGDTALGLLGDNLRKRVVIGTEWLPQHQPAYNAQRRPMAEPIV